MASKADKFPDNLDGKYYVDTQCIVCGACESTAGDFFKLSDDGSHDVVYKQPVSEEDMRICEEAREGCPVDAIGNDGDA